MGDRILDAGPNTPGLHLYADCQGGVAGGVTVLAMEEPHFSIGSETSLASGTAASHVCIDKFDRARDILCYRMAAFICFKGQIAKLGCRTWADGSCPSVAIAVYNATITKERVSGYG